MFVLDLLMSDRVDKLVELDLTAVEEEQCQAGESCAK
jgi:hypothetical protein